MTRVCIDYAITGLLGLVCCFLFLSASTTIQLGSSPYRILTFSVLVALLAIIGLAAEPRIFEKQLEVPLLLFALLAGMALTDLFGHFEPLDYKVALPLLMMLIAPNLYRALGNIDLTRCFFGVLTAYVTVTSILIFVFGRATLSIRSDDLTRLDITGSVVTHSSLCLIFVVVGFSHLHRTYAGSPAKRFLMVALIACALFMITLTAARTVVASILIFWILFVASNRRPGKAALHAIGGLVTILCLLAIYSLVINDTLLLRLAGAQGDFSSG
ncbi:MAG: hypothetical protein AAFY56_11495, partial [Pseudomonadota bacterium]